MVPPHQALSMAVNSSPSIMEGGIISNHVSYRAACKAGRFSASLLKDTSVRYMFEPHLYHLYSLCQSVIAFVSVSIHLMRSNRASAEVITGPELER